MSITVKRVFFILYIVITFCHVINSKPIDVTGKNIQFYKLTPNAGSGDYKFNYGTRDGSERSERGFIKREPDGRPLLTVTGTFKYKDSNGDEQEVSYIADEDGYRIVTKEELEKFQEQLPNEILPTASSGLPSPLPSSSSLPHVSSSSISAVSRSHGPLSQSSVAPGLPPTPTTESQIIKLKVIKPPSDITVLCAPGQCTGVRQSKIYKIKSLKIH